MRFLCGFRLPPAVRRTSSGGFSRISTAAPSARQISAAACGRSEATGFMDPLAGANSGGVLGEARCLLLDLLLMSPADWFHCSRGGGGESHKTESNITELSASSDKHLGEGASKCTSKIAGWCDRQGMRNGMTPRQTIQLLVSFRGSKAWFSTFPAEHQHAKEGF